MFRKLCLVLATISVSLVALVSASVGSPVTPRPVPSMLAASSPRRPHSLPLIQCVYNGQPSRCAFFNVMGDVTILKTTRDSNSDQAQGNPTDAKCSVARDKLAVLEAKGVANASNAIGATEAADLMHHYLGASGDPIMYGPSSPLASEVAHSDEFQKLSNAVDTEVLRRLAAGETTITLDHSFLKALRPNFDNFRREPNLYLAFRGTQGLRVLGTGRKSGGQYYAGFMYTISDIYGFSSDPKFRILGHAIGPDMHYLQTICGGAHWFRDSVQVTVPDHPLK